METMDIVNRYVSVWNEPDAGERRRRIRSLWAADGTTCHRPLEAHGWELDHQPARKERKRILRRGCTVMTFGIAWAQTSATPPTTGLAPGAGGDVERRLGGAGISGHPRTARDRRRRGEALRS